MMYLQVPYKEMMQRVHDALKGQQQQPLWDGLQAKGVAQGTEAGEHAGRGTGHSSGGSTALGPSRIKLVREDDPVGEVAKNFKVPGHKGTVSFITSMTSHFCGECNRYVPQCSMGIDEAAVLQMLSQS